MLAPELADSFLELLQRSGLLSPDRIASADRRLRLRELPSAKDAARALVRQKLITRFQAEWLLKGSYRGFFIDQYKVLEILGFGGMGWLYTAEDTRSGQKVALKVFSEYHEDDPGIRARFELEGLAGLKLKHPNIVRTHKIDHAGDIYYIVMDYVEGISLQELLVREGPCPVAQACDFICQAASGLKHAHQAGMVHRDVKPANLLVERDGTVKVLDFGLALLDIDDSEFSLAMIFGQDCLGTADYSAPEQTVDSYQVDARADVYSLGCTFYSALTAKVPFPAKTISDKLAAHRKLRAKPLRERAPHVPEQVALLVERMMAKRPEKRPQSCDEVYRALAPFAKRTPARFSLSAVLAERAREAKRRVAALSSSDSASATMGTRSPRTTISLTNPLSTRRRKKPQPAEEPKPTSVEIRHAETGEVLIKVDGESLEGAALANSSLMGADLAGADLSGATLMNADLRGARLAGAKLCEANLFNCLLTGADLSGADLSRAEMTDANLADCDLSGAIFTKTTLRNAQITGAKARRADFNGADLSMARLEADLREASLARADLRGAALAGSNFCGADLDSANLAGANLAGANLTDAKLRGAIGPHGKPFPELKPKDRGRKWWPKRSK